MAAEITHCAVPKIPPAIPSRPRKICRMVRPFPRGAEPQTPVQVRGNRHLLFESVHDLNAVVESVRFVELFGRGSVLQTPGAVRPDVDLMHRTDDSGVENLFDHPPRGRGMPLVSHLGG